MPPYLPTTEELDAMNNEWVEPNTTAYEGMTYALYDQPVRGEDKQGSYWYSLPEGYETDTAKRYPVLVWLHGGMSRGSQAATAVKMYREAMAKGTMPPTILVAPQGLPVGWYINSIDHKFPVEDVLIKDLLPHLDATFRTNGKRGIEGFSMGGYGAAHLGIRYNSLFRGVSSIAPAVLPSLANEPKERVWDTFRGDQSYYDKEHPLFLLREKSEELRTATIRVRLLSGGDDTRLTEAIAKMSAVMNELGVVHYRKDIAGAGHEYDQILEGLADDAFTFWNDAFAN
ncbi:hypothetical protein ASPZODRAFT_17333 [Penicilliopsis zonata CBS 506.65]|uniref:Esterase n=1 Tax=Penicilliopsis zonata CBS 506.65 TaxID=1073090 RepID=A0A1L9SFA8_9EURO|nr:hypothetical protein ASPZODRAFT_17333 [Penicilliopsis zonata CBS 506.65]OJJ45900.1 hypothetical protein ASPZODRAFT_17333 [Penicilliopsis zonata CBS 506.65]